MKITPQKLVDLFIFHCIIKPGPQPGLLLLAPPEPGQRLLVPVAVSEPPPPLVLHHELVSEGHHTGVPPTTAPVAPAAVDQPLVVHGARAPDTRQPHRGGVGGQEAALEEVVSLSWHRVLVRPGLLGELAARYHLYCSVRLGKRHTKVQPASEELNILFHILNL